MKGLRDEALIRRSQSYLCWGGVVVLVTISAIGTGHLLGYVIAGLGAILGGLSIHAGLELRRLATALPLYRELIGLVGTSRIDEAEALLDSVAASPEFAEALVARVVTTLRATIANVRGDFSGAVAAANQSLALPRRKGRVWEDVLHLEARSQRALANAALGHGIAEDVEVIGGATHAVSSILARAELARAVSFAKRDERKELAEHLDRQGGLILGHASPRERALYRALRAWTRAANTIYRAAPTANGDGKLSEWIAKLVPAASAFAPNEPTRRATPPLPPVDAARASAIIAARLANVPPRRRARARAFAIGLVMAAAFAFGTTSAIGFIFVGALVLGLYAYVRAYGNGGQTAILEAERDIALGRIANARRQLRRVTKSGTTLGASAGQLLATLANREADWISTLAEVEQSLALCKEPAALEATRFFVLPGLLAESAVALAALGRVDEMERELMTLREGFPAYSALAAAIFRARLVSAMQRGDLEAARTIAATRTTELPLDLATELLADLALGDRAFESELGANPMTAAWLRKVAPAAYGIATTSTSSNETAPTAS